GEQGLVTGLVRFRLLEKGLVRSRIDLRQQLAGSHVLAFAESDLLYLAVDPNLDRHGVVGLHGAEADAIDRKVLGLDGGRSDGKRTPGRRARTCRISGDA